MPSRFKITIQIEDLQGGGTPLQVTPANVHVPLLLWRQICDDGQERALADALFMPMRSAIERWALPIDLTGVSLEQIAAELDRRAAYDPTEDLQ